MFGAVASPTVPKAFGIEALTADMRREPHFYAATDLANPFCLRARMTNRRDKSFKKTNTFAGTQLTHVQNFAGFLQRFGRGNDYHPSNLMPAFCTSA